VSLACLSGTPTSAVLTYCLLEIFEKIASEIDSRLEELFAAMGVATQAEAIAAAHKRGLLKKRRWRRRCSRKLEHRALR